MSQAAVPPRGPSEDESKGRDGGVPTVGTGPAARSRAPRCHHGPHVDGDRPIPKASARWLCNPVRSALFRFQDAQEAAAGFWGVRGARGGKPAGDRQPLSRSRQSPGAVKGEAPVLAPNFTLSWHLRSCHPGTSLGDVSVAPGSAPNAPQQGGSGAQRVHFLSLSFHSKQVEISRARAGAVGGERVTPREWEFWGDPREGPPNPPAPEPAMKSNIIAGRRRLWNQSGRALNPLIRIRQRESRRQQRP